MSQSQTIKSTIQNISNEVSTAQNIKIVSDLINSNTIQPFNFFNYLPLLIILTILGLIGYIFIKKRKSGTQNIIALIGQRSSGKTQLFIRINNGKTFQTVPSIKNNQTSYKNPSSRKVYQMIDYCGDNISKQEVLNSQNYPNLNTIIQVIDGADSKKLGDAALFIYKVLINKAYQKRQCNFLIFLNKEDSENFLTKIKIVKRLEDEIQHIKISKRNSSEENQEEEDFLKTSKQRFDLAKSGIKIVAGAAKQGNLKQLQKELQNIL